MSISAESVLRYIALLISEKRNRKANIFRETNKEENKIS
jgi:hypothetical protein